MENMIFEKVEDVITQMNTGDLKQDNQVVNAILNGKVQIEKKEEPITETNVENSVNIISQEQNKDNIDNSSVSIIDPLKDEVERQKRYNEMLEKRRQEERENFLRINKENEDKLIKEQKDREELEKKLRELEQIKNDNHQQTQLENSETDEEFVSDYTKRTRQMIEELKQSIGNENPLVNQLRDQITNIEKEVADYKAEKAERKRFQDEKRQKEEQEKVFNDIRHFLTEHPELKPSKDIYEIDNEYKQFRKDIAYISHSQNLEELEKAIDDYKKGGPIKKLADQQGIKSVQDLDKYDSIAELLDFKIGLKYEPVLGKHVPILDENGVQVRYGSLNEAYNIKNYYDNLTNIKRQAYKNVSAKLEQFNSAPVVLQQDQTDTFSTGITLDQEKEILAMNPKEWTNNLEKRKMVELVYSKYGLEMPKYRGRN